MYIEKVYPCIDPALIVIELLELEKHIFIVWDVEANKEIYNYSTSQNSKFIVGCGSKAGYLELEDCIVDLDTKIVDYNFKVKYKYLSQGYMYNLMSKDKKMLISNGTITTKSTLLDASIFDNLISGHTRITKKGICRELVNFEINRIT